MGVINFMDYLPFKSIGVIQLKKQSYASEIIYLLQVERMCVPYLAWTKMYGSPSALSRGFMGKSMIDKQNGWVDTNMHSMLFCTVCWYTISLAVHSNVIRELHNNSLITDLQKLFVAYYYEVLEVVQH